VKRHPHEETRAEIARRRLAQLAASFDAELPPIPESKPELPPRRIEIVHVKVLATLATAGAVLLVWWLLSGRPQTSAPTEPLAFATTGTPSTSASAAAPTTDLVIDVIGKVRNPGIVTVPKGSRVYEAIEAAGGVRGKPDTSTLNMARVLADGEQILVGMQPAAAPGMPAGSAGGSPAGTKVNLNTATAEQLDTLPGVGPVTAQAILDWREENGRFGSVEDLLDVKGIGDATLDDLRDLVTV
jgi:competence protein ComEA